MIDLDPALTFFSAINLMGAAQGVLLAAALVFYSDGNRLANRLLAGLVAAVALIVADVFLCASNLILHVPHLVDSTEPLILVLGPLFYFYIQALVTNDTSFQRRSWWHFLPVVLYTLYLIPFYIAPVSVKIEAFLSVYHPDLAAAHESPGEPAFFDVLPLRANVAVLALLSIFGYTLAAVRLVCVRWKSTDDTASHRSLLTVMGVAFLNFLVPVCTWAFWELTTGDANEAVVAAVAAVGLYGLGYLALFRPSFFPNQLHQGAPEKYARSSLTDAQESAMREVMVQALEADERFRDASLNLAGFARSCGLTRHQVSQIANTHFGGFSDFVNRRRVEAAKVLLREPEGHVITLEEVGYRVGFNSRTAFYNAFKKHAGCPPSHYRDHVDDEE